MSKTLLDAPIYINTYRLAGIVYDLRFVMPKRDRAVFGERVTYHVEKESVKEG